MRIRRSLLIILILSLVSCTGAETKSVQVEVSGTIRYEDRIYDTSGFTGDSTFQYVRFAPVELVDGTAVVDVDVTDANGHFELTGAGTNLYVRVVTESAADSDANISIKNFSKSVYAVTKTISGEGEIELDFDIGLSNGAAGAFNILDVYISASQFVDSLTTRTMPALSAYWQPKSSRFGTYFCPYTTSGGSCPYGKGIYLLGGNSGGGDTDEYDDDVLLHEYGHYIESMLGIQDSPGGTHYLTDIDSDLRLAFSEGWGGFFPGAVKKWLKQTEPSLLSSVSSMPASQFVDTYGNYAGISIDMASPNSSYCFSSSGCYVYSSSEVAVATVLNGLLDEINMQAIWDSVAEYMPSQTSYSASLETFWDGWVAQRAPTSGEYSLVNPIFEDRKVYYQLDGFEGDSDISSATTFTPCANANCAGQQHYLYQYDLVADKDNVGFSAQAGKSYVVETLELSNGADTSIRLLDSNGIAVTDENGLPIANDDRPNTVYCYPLENPCKVHNDDLMLSSQVTFTPQISGNYTVEISTAGSRPSAAGRYGTYSVRIYER